MLSPASTVLLRTLLSPALLPLVTSFQHGIYVDMLPFLVLDVVPRRSQLHLFPMGTRTITDCNDAMALIFHPLFSVWFATHGLDRLPKLVACLPFLRFVVADYAAWAGHVDLLEWCHRTYGIETLHSTVDIAAERQHVDVLCYVLAQDDFDKAIDMATLESAAKAGHLVVLRCLVESCLVTLSRNNILQLLEAALQAGTMDIVVYLLDDVLASSDIVHEAWCVPCAALAGHHALTLALLDRGFATLDLSLDAAAEGGSVELVAYLHDLGGFDCTTHAMDTAAASGHLDVVRWLHANRTEGCSFNAVCHAATRGHVDIVAFLYEAYPTLVTGCRALMTSSIDTAAAHGHWSLVRCVLQHNLGACPANLLDSVAERGNLDTAQWLVHNQTTLGFQTTWTTEAMDMAAEHGHLAMMTWLHERDPTIGCSPNAGYKALANGHVDIVRWLFARRLYDRVTASAALKAIQNGHITSVEAFEATIFTPECVDATDALRAAALFRHVKMVRWLLQHQVHACAACALGFMEENGAEDIVVHVLRLHATKHKGACRCRV
ncbi:Aste57867_680 [Aphanomyces stellatus]|uniref:Aste57867_680 protein n=1 Tax=Aphanomyces stellatus TaxID=120398 RepID=A0A485K891_9STRA|nr:hypothetical protein As57867_000679 [Aphanomyces stellatus]VFT77905.1 Aste57867_680 [Aphanomyces stellatus]